MHLPEEWADDYPAGLPGGVRGDRGRLLRPPRGHGAARETIHVEHLPRGSAVPALAQRRRLHPRRALDARRRGDAAVRPVVLGAPARPAHQAAAEHRHRPPGRGGAERRGQQQHLHPDGAGEPGGGADRRRPAADDRPGGGSGLLGRRELLLEEADQLPGEHRARTPSAASPTRSRPTGATACASRPTSWGRAPRVRTRRSIDPTMLKTLQKQVGDTISIAYTGGREQGQAAGGLPADWTIVGTYTIADDDRRLLVRPGAHLRRRPPAPAAAGCTTAARRPRCSSTASGIRYDAVGGAERPIDLQKVDIATMDAAQANLAAWQAEIAGEPAAGHPERRRRQPPGPLRGRPRRAAPALPDHPGRDRAAHRAGPAAALRAGLLGRRGTPPGGGAGEAARLLDVEGRAVRRRRARGRAAAHRPRRHRPRGRGLPRRHEHLARPDAVRRHPSGGRLRRHRHRGRARRLRSSPCSASSESRWRRRWPRRPGGVRRRAGPCSPRAPWSCCRWRRSSRS